MAASTAPASNFAVADEALASNETGEEVTTPSLFNAESAAIPQGTE